MFEEEGNNALKDEVLLSIPGALGLKCSNNSLVVGLEGVMESGS